MIEQQARVVGIEHEQAWLEPVREHSCGLCGQTQGCGASLMGRFFGHRPRALRAENPIGARVGDSVMVGMEARALLEGVLAVYGIPLALVLAGAVGGAVVLPLPGQDVASIAGALAGLVLSGLWLWLGARRFGRRPVILRQATEADFVQKCQKGK